MRHSDALRYRAVRRYGDARANLFGDELDKQIDSFLDHLKEHAPDAFERLEDEIEIEPNDPDWYTP